VYFTGNEVAIVTGSSRGIGRAIAVDLAKEGASVVVTYNGSENAAQKTLQEIEVLGAKTLLIKCDVSKELDVKMLVKKTIETFGRLDVFVNNAGIAMDQYLGMLSLERWQKVLDTNLTGCFLCCRQAAKAMINAKNGGSIVNITSISGISGQIGQTNYSASKGGIIAMTKTIAKEVARYNIRVNAVAPGFIATDMTKAVDKELMSKFVQYIALRRIGQPEEVAKAVSFLASPNASYITGKVLTVDGGLIDS
jgi:3-oxoacyl-[acyl-carrier protein] reductase